MTTEAERSGWAALRGPSQVLFGLAILLSAFLIFFVQPMVGKRILPLFGGVPGVWTLCLAFYQVVLFLGYAYAHFLIRHVGASLQVVVHALVVVLAVLVGPVLPDASWEGADLARPTEMILRMLAVHVGLPFFVLASTGPLVQAWFARRHPESSPYPLYALSNLGSLLALFAYPFLIEPRFGLAETAEFWSWSFVLSVALVLACALVASRRRRVPAPQTSEGRGDLAEGLSLSREVTAGKIGSWILLSGTAVVMMMAITNHLCRDIASVPFLWILPLAAYLATFILCFSFERAYHRGTAVGIVVVALLLGASGTLLRLDFFGGGDSSLSEVISLLPFEVGRICLLLFGVCLILHGELHRLRPGSSELTLYYLCISAGGAIGGLFVGIAAPVVFSAHYELGMAAVLAFGFLLLLSRAERSAGERRRGVAAFAKSSGAWIAVALLATHELWAAINPDANQIHQERNFFGVLRVLEVGTGEGRHRILLHGSTTHGLQFIDGANRAIPTAYYGRASALAAMLSMRDVERRMRLGVIGLGVGTVSAYARRGDLVRFYEIDPAVVRIARESGLFSFMARSPATLQTRVADARLALQREHLDGIRQDFDFLFVDAFSSDAIPVHLLTRDGLEHYERALGEGGLLLVHLSNRHFDLGPIVARVAEDVGLAPLLIRSTTRPELQTLGAEWALLSRDRARLDEFESASGRLLASYGLPAATHRIRRLTASELAAVRPWTDDYSDLFGALR